MAARARVQYSVASLRADGHSGSRFPISLASVRRRVAGTTAAQCGQQRIRRRGSAYGRMEQRPPLSQSSYQLARAQMGNQHPLAGARHCPPAHPMAAPLGPSHVPHPPTQPPPTPRAHTPGSPSPSCPPPAPSIPTCLPRLPVPLLLCNVERVRIPAEQRNTPIGRSSRFLARACITCIVAAAAGAGCRPRRRASGSGPLAHHTYPPHAAPPFPCGRLAVHSPLLSSSSLCCCQPRRCAPACRRRPRPAPARLCPPTSRRAATPSPAAAPPYCSPPPPSARRASSSSTPSPLSSTRRPQVARCTATASPCSTARAR